MEKENVAYTNGITLIKFLKLYFGVSPAKAKNMTHKDACRLFSLNSLTNEDFYKHDKENLRTNYIRVIDKNNKVVYYEKMLGEEKLEMVEESAIIECNDSEFNDFSEIEYKFMELKNIDIQNLTPYQLQALKKQLKGMKKYIRGQIDEKINKIDKRLRYMKRRDRK